MSGHDGDDRERAVDDGNAVVDPTAGDSDAEPGTGTDAVKRLGDMLRRVQRDEASGLAGHTDTGTEADLDIDTTHGLAPEAPGEGGTGTEA